MLFDKMVNLRKNDNDNYGEIQRSFVMSQDRKHNYNELKGRTASKRSKYYMIAYIALRFTLQLSVYVHVTVHVTVSVLLVFVTARNCISIRDIAVS